MQGCLERHTRSRGGSRQAAIPHPSWVIGVVILTAFGCTAEQSNTGGDGRVASTNQALVLPSQCVEFPAAADALLSNPPMDHNFGALPILRAGGKDEAIVEFDLSSVPVSSVVDSATLKLYVSGTDPSAAPVNLHRATAPWSESTVTFQSFAQHFDPTVVGSIVATGPNVLKSVDVTAVVKSWLAGAAANAGLLLEKNSDNKTIFVSREGGTPAQRPELDVCYRTVVDQCSPTPCLNGGTCQNGDSGYTCECPPGYTGTNCEALIDDCASAPCQNAGTCTSGVNAYACSCPAGFTGTNCEINVDDCSPNPCQNGGVCQDGVASHTCSCPPGYTGADCETLIDNCAAAPCQNGGTCTSGVNAYACSCVAGFTGTNCEINIDDCAPDPCQNGGTCIDGIDSYTCSCPPDWGGTNCDVNLNTCSQNPCLNGSSCTNGFGTYTCACVAGFTGTNCEVDIDDCAPNPCLNGGVCVDGVNTFTCNCATGFTGTRCETAQQPTVATQTFTPVQDTFVNSGYPNNNNGGDGFIYTGTDDFGGLMHGLIQFAMPPGLEGRTTVIGVRLSLFPGVFGPSERPAQANETLYAVGQLWDEGNGLAPTPDDFAVGLRSPSSPGATWTFSTFETQWVSAGGDPTSLVVSGLPSSGSGGGSPVVWSSAQGSGMAAAVQSWLDVPLSNHGWLIVNSSESSDPTLQPDLVQSFASRESATPPTLAIDYVCKTGFALLGAACTPCTPAATANCAVADGNLCSDTGALQYTCDCSNPSYTPGPGGQTCVPR